MENKKILVGVLLITLLATGATFASSTITNNTNFKVKTQLTQEQKTQIEEIKILMEKVKNGETLTNDEQTKLDEFKTNIPRKGEKGRGGKMGNKICNKMGERIGGGFGMINNLTTEEKTLLESMTNDEKKIFFETKRKEQEAKREVRENVIDKLLNGETLTKTDEVVVEEIKLQRIEKNIKKSKMTEFKALIEKVKNGETLTTDEQIKLDELKVNMPQKNKGKR